MSAAKTIDWSVVRKDFPVLDQEVHGQPLIYFDNAATSQKPRQVIDALVHYYEHDNANMVSDTRGTCLTEPLEGIVDVRDGCSDNYAADCWSLRWALPQASGVMS